jgi:hypothetical protein
MGRFLFAGSFYFVLRLTYTIFAEREYNYADFY